MRYSVVDGRLLLAGMLVLAAAGCTDSPTHGQRASAAPSPSVRVGESGQGSVTRVGQLRVTPAGLLRDGQAVSVRLMGFPANLRVRLSECAARRPVTGSGCGVQPAQQTSIDLDRHGTGAVTFTVTAYAARSANTAPIPSSCQSGCLLEAIGVTPAGLHDVVTRGLRFVPATWRLTPPDHLSPPASGACAQSSGRLVTIQLNPDTPAPRCVIVRGNQHLEILNTSDRFGAPGRTATVRWPPYPVRTLAPGAKTAYLPDFSTYLATGIHDVTSSLYAGSGAEIWLR